MGMNAPYQWSDEKKLNASQQAARRSAQLEAQGRAIIALAALVARQSGSTGPDVLRRITDPETALTVLDSAGYGARQLAAGWQADAPAPRPRQESAQQNSAYASDPDHDPRVTALLQRGASWAELNAVRAEVRDEYAGRRLAQQRRDDTYHGRDQTGAGTGITAGPDGFNQRSVVHNDVPELGSSEV